MEVVCNNRELQEGSSRKVVPSAVYYLYQALLTAAHCSTLKPGLEVDCSLPLLQGPDPRDAAGDGQADSHGPVIDAD